MDYVKGLVSVVIPTYKRSDLLVRAIKSVLSQTYSNLECVVVNDNIKGDEYSLEVYGKIKEFENDNRFIFIEQPTHINGAAARNFGIKKAKGEYIAFLDDDDYWEKEKIDLQVKRLESLDASWGAVSCLTRSVCVDEVVNVSFPHHTGDLLFSILSRRIGLGTGAVLIRREVLDNVGYFDESLVRHQDLQLFARLAAGYKIDLIKKYLYNIEISNTINRPNVENLVNIKKAYFKSIEDIMQGLPKRVQKRIYILHDFELSFSYLKSKKYKLAFSKAIKIFRSPITLYIACERVFKRILGKYFQNHFNKKYS